MRVSFSKYSSGMLLAILLEMAAASPAWSQAAQKPVPGVGDYGRWGKLDLERMSPDGRFVSFTMHYPGAVDTLFVKDNKSGAMVSFADGKNGIFTDDGRFIYKSLDSSLCILNLKGGISSAIADVKDYRYISERNMLIYSGSEGGRDYLGIKSLAGNAQAKVWDVTAYACNEKAGAILCSRKSGGWAELVSVSLEGRLQQDVLMPGKPGEFTNLAWKPSGDAVAFLHSPTGEGSPPVLCHYDIPSGKLRVFDPAEESSFPSGYSISRIGSSNLKVSPDGERVFFKIEHKGEPPIAPGSVQIWNAADKYLYPVRRRADGGVKYAKLAVWLPRTGHFEVISDNTYSEAMLVGDDRYVIMIAPDRHEPQWNYYALRDYMLYDLVSGGKKVFLEKQSIESDHFATSPASRHVMYFRDGHWWLYDLHTASHTNITRRIDSDFVREGMDVTSGAMAWGHGGWTADDRSVLFYDKHDIWMYDTKTGAAKRLTNGKEDGLTYRVAPPENGTTGYTVNYDGQQSRLLDSDGISFEITGRGQSGYCLFSFKDGCVSKLVMDKKITAMVKASASPVFTYIEQDFNKPPAVMVNNGGRVQNAYQSNPHHFTFEWGKSELISYRNSKGRKLDAALYYPAGYRAGIRYPMIVYIYDTQAAKVHNYVPPSLGNSNGMNITNYTLDGYFVLVPDIAYEVGGPGYSATDCVVSVTREVLSRNCVDSARIGLIGHSFGGYETDFIITQTDLFTAAVSGAAITDLPSSYLYASWNYSRPNFWHYEYGQLRMGSGLFDDFPGYVSNSPVYHAAKVRTPLLSWTGEDDRQVHYYQSIEFYLALRRLKKEHIMLIYPGQGHAVSGQQAQDLTIRVGQWFGYYLKGCEPPEWLKADLPH